MLREKRRWRGWFKSWVFLAREFYWLGIVNTSHLPLSSSYPIVISGAAWKMAMFSHKGKSARLCFHGSDRQWLN